MDKAPVSVFVPTWIIGEDLHEVTHFATFDIMSDWLESAMRLAWTNRGKHTFPASDLSVAVGQTESAHAERALSGARFPTDKGLGRLFTTHYVALFRGGPGHQG